MRVNRLSAAAVAALLVLPACKKNEPAPAAGPSPAAQPTAATTPQGGTAASTPQSSNDAGTPQGNAAPGSAPAATSQGPCTVTFRQSFHLRPTATAASVGQQLPAGTQADVLEANWELRRRGTAMLRVRVHPTSTEGFAFVAPEELSPGCGLFWPHPPVAGERTTAEAGTAPFPTRDAAIASLAHGSAPIPASARPTVLAHADLDGDGTDDEFVKFQLNGERPSASYVALLHPAAGFVTAYIGEDSVEEHASFADNSSVGDLLRAGPAAYFVLESGETPSDDPPSVVDDHSYEIFRCRPGGPCARVFAAHTLFGSVETWTFTGNPDGSVTVRGYGDRTATLRWDPAQFRLVAP